MFRFAERAVERLYRRMSAAVPPPNIVLIGFMGSGKSSIGRLVAGQLGFNFVDTDALVVEKAGMEISAIFKEHGEAYFRDLESSVLASLAGREYCVISTGGGIILRPDNRALLHQLGLVVLLMANEEVLFERVSRNTRRPLLQTENPRETLHTMLASRRSLYEEASQYTLDTSEMEHREAAAAVLTEARRVFSWQDEE